MAHSGKTMTFATDILPEANDTYNLGNSTHKWKIAGELTGNATNVTGTVEVEHGGTGSTSFNANSAIISGSSTTAAFTSRSILNNTTATAVASSTALITANTLYYHKGNSNIVTVGTISSGTWQGTSIKVGYGGTGTTAAPIKGGIIYGASTSAYACTTTGTLGQLLQSSGTAAPTWITATSTDTADTILKRDSNGAVTIRTLTVGSRNTSTAPSDYTSINRIIITPYYRTDGPWNIASKDNSSTSLLTVSFNTSELVSLKKNGDLTAVKVYQAVWNDYAECREAETEEPGYCVTETPSGKMIKTTERLQAGCKVTSDTYGTCMGMTDRAKTPIAVAGRALVYPFRKREEYALGAAVCSAPNGTVDIMTREEIMKYPERIVGTVSEIPNYETWYGGSKDNPQPIHINNRIWIYIR